MAEKYRCISDVTMRGGDHFGKIAFTAGQEYTLKWQPARERYLGKNNWRRDHYLTEEFVETHFVHIRTTNQGQISHDDAWDRAFKGM